MGADDSQFPSLAGWINEETEPALAARIAAEVGALAGMDLDDLRALCRRLTRSKAPEHLRPWLLRKVLGYRIKARAFGDLDAATLRALDVALREGRRARADKAKSAAINAPTRHLPPPRPRGHRPGTIFLREYNGEMHRVTQRAGGFEYRGATYASLSPIAKLITGTSWNGPRFFGLRDEKAKALARASRGASAPRSPAMAGDHAKVVVR